MDGPAVDLYRAQIDRAGIEAMEHLAVYPGRSNRSGSPLSTSCLAARVEGSIRGHN